jgi:ABC-type bacteriocin/lantibiotic exporter with double-glycine peptidase domain
MKNQKPKQVESSSPPHFPLSLIFFFSKSTLKIFELLVVSLMYQTLSLITSHSFYLTLFFQAISMKNDKSSLFTFSSLGRLHTPSFLFVFIFSLLAAYKEGCFGQSFNLVRK